LASHERSDSKKDQGFSTNVLRYDAAALTHDRREFEREVAHTRTEIHDDTAFAEIQRLDYVRRALPMVSLAFDSIQRIESLNALVKIAEEEK